MNLRTRSKKQYTQILLKAYRSLVYSAVIVSKTSSEIPRQASTSARNVQCLECSECSVELSILVVSGILSMPFIVVSAYVAIPVSIKPAHRYRS